MAVRRFWKWSGLALTAGPSRATLRRRGDDVRGPWIEHASREAAPVYTAFVPLGRQSNCSRTIRSVPRILKANSSAMLRISR
jgi:hypothetical protein